MYQDFQNIILDGKKFGVRELQKMTSILSWKNDVYQFIREWLDGKPAIQVSTSGTTGTPKTIFLQKNKMKNLEKKQTPIPHKSRLRFESIFRLKTLS